MDTALRSLSLRVSAKRLIFGMRRLRRRSLQVVKKTRSRAEQMSMSESR